MKSIEYNTKLDRDMILHVIKFMGIDFEWYPDDTKNGYSGEFIVDFEFDDMIDFDKLKEQYIRSL